MTDAQNGRRNEQLREQLLLGLLDPIEKAEQIKPVDAHIYTENAPNDNVSDKESENSPFHQDNLTPIKALGDNAKVRAKKPLNHLKDKIISQFSDGQLTEHIAALRAVPLLVRTAILSCILIEYERGTVFLILAVTAAAGAVFYFRLDHEPGWSGMLLATAILFVAYVLSRKKIVVCFCIAFCLAAILGMIGAKYEVMRYDTKMLGGEVSTILTGRIVSLEQQARGGWRVIVDVVKTEKPQLRHVPDRLRLTGRDLPAQADIGSILQGPVRLRAHGGPVRPGHYDFAFHGFFKNIGGNGFYLGVPQHLLANDWTDTTQGGVVDDISGVIAQLRAVIAGRIMQALPGENGAIAAALVSGQRAGITEQTNEALRVAGLAHILSISGLHLALAAGVVMVSIRSCAAVFPTIALNYPVKKYAAVISLLSSAFYLALSGADVAAQRSFTMITVMLCAVLFDRLALTMRNLAIAAMISVALTPHEILGPSFQMSYSATAALIAAFAWWKNYKAGRYNNKNNERYELRPVQTTNRQFSRWIFQPLIATIVTSVVAGIASGVYAAYHFHNVAPLGLLGNGLALPAVSIVVMPSAVISLLAMPFGLEWLPLQVMGLGISLVKWAAKFVADISPDIIPAIMPDATLLLWTIALVNIIIFSSWLRWLSIGWFLCGLFFFQHNTKPDIVVSEDARLVTIIDGDKLYSNRSRPSQFIINSWLKAYGAEQVIGPQQGRMADGDKRFICEEKLCVATLTNGQILAHAEDEGSGVAACIIADIVVLAYSGEKAKCADNNDRLQMVVTKQDLALKGATTLYLQEGVNEELFIRDGKSKPTQPVIEVAFDAEPDEYFESDISYYETDSEQSIAIYPSYVPENVEMHEQIAKAHYAIGAPERPWHLYRLYSRAARNKPDWYKEK